MKWRTREGKEIEVSDMETSHIKNALAMLKRKGFIAPSTLKFYMTTAGPNGDMAQDCFEQELEEILEAPVAPIIDLFKEELRKRGQDVTANNSL